jgi:hypothetical protein
LILEFPAAGKMAGNLCGSGVNQAIPARIGSAASKACGKFPTRQGRELFRQGQGTFFAQAGNSSVGTGMLGIDWFMESISTEFRFDRYLPVL